MSLVEMPAGARPLGNSLTQELTESWPVAQVGAELHTQLPGIRVEVRAEETSTNTTLLARARSGEATPALLVAEHQTAGRGRMGRSWHAAAGDSLTFSLALPYAPADWSGLSLAVGVALADALDPQGHAIGLKWPNDLWLRDGSHGPGRKLGGVLIETVPVPTGRVCVVGVGLNVRPREVSGLATGYACLREIDPQASAAATWRQVAAPLLRALLRFEREGLHPFLDGFSRRDLLRDAPVTTTLPELPQGIARGVAPDGTLRVEDARGQVRQVAAGDVSIRPAGLAQGSA
jgi:BirA family biotin operon repressor/biotin-[acetyl-CoA-carboxylase] ligase